MERRSIIHRSVGSSGLRVSPVGLGTVRFGDTLDLAETRAVVDAALDAGITLIDTADGYAKSRSEELLGKALQGHRDDVVISTKFGAGLGGRLGADFGARASRRYIVRAVEASLRRLRTDYIDLYQLHMPDGVTPLEETVAALDSLTTAGKIRYAGSSHLAAWQVNEVEWIARDRHLTRFVSVQDHYSLLRRDAEDEILPACREHGIGFLAFFPLATGLLTGRWHGGEPLAEGSRMWQCRSLGLASDHTAAVLDELEAFAAEREISLVDVAIGWLTAQPGVSSVIAGATSVEQVRANAAAGAVTFSPAEIAQLSRITKERGATAPSQQLADDRPPPQNPEAARLLLDGASADEARAALVTGGSSEAAAAAACRDLMADPVFRLGLESAQRLHKLESVLTMRQTMRELTDYGSSIERRDNLSTEEFLEVYYAGNLPVVLTDTCEAWPARSWTLDHLADTIGDVQVEVMTGRQDDARYEVNSNEHKTPMSFADYIRLIGEQDGNDSYIVANNHLLEAPAAEALWDDFAPDARYLDPDAGKETAFLWLGPAGTVTPLHHDVVNILFTQVLGEKRVTLISPLETHAIYNDIGVYSQVDPAAPDLEKFPRFADTRRFEVTLSAGDALFIPAGWWHHVESLTASASISFTGFAFPNVIEWFHPEPIG